MKNEYWACIDVRGTYMPTLHHAKYAAEDDRREHSHLTDGKFIVAKVRLVKVRKWKA